MRRAEPSMPLPLPDVAVSIDAGLEQAVLRMLRRRKRRPKWVAKVEAEELARARARQRPLKFPPPYVNRANRRPCQYPFEMVEYARKLRSWGFFYREISEELEHRFGRRVPWLTVRDWVQYVIRVSG